MHGTQSPTSTVGPITGEGADMLIERIGETSGRYAYRKDRGDFGAAIFFVQLKGIGACSEGRSCLLYSSCSVSEGSSSVW